MRDERKRQKTVRDGCTIGRFTSGAFGIQVNPLPILGGFGELVNAWLRDHEPFAGGNFLANQRLQFAGVGKCCWHPNTPNYCDR